MDVIVRTIELENGNKVNFTAGPRYPHWKISFERGGTPAKLQGVYLDYDRAVEAVRHHVENRPTRNRTKLKEDQ